MTVARRLLMAGSGGAVTLPPLSFTLTSPDEGGWTQANAPSAVEYGGYLYFGYVDMANGNIEVRSMLLTAPYTVSSATVAKAALEVDTHAAPSLYVRPDGRLLIVYSAHQGATIYRRITTNALPDLTLGSEASLDASIGSAFYTYPILVGYGSDIWMFFRDDQDAGTTAVLCYSISTDNGSTWSARVQLYKSATRRSYWQVDSTGSRIDIATSDGRNPPDSGDVPIYHFYYDGTWRASDGTSIGSPIFDPTDLTEVYDSSDGMGWPMDIVAGTEPAFTYAVLNDPSSNSWRRARWDGSSWDLTTIDESDGDIDSGFAASVCLDHEDPNTAYAPVYDGSYWQMHRYRYDGSWTGSAITEGTDDHIYPAPVYGHTGLVRVLWLSGGPYVSYLSGGFGITAGR